VRGLGLQRAAPADLDFASLLDTTVNAAEHSLGCYSQLRAAAAGACARALVV
jgi:hypothetical protein